MRLPPGFTSPSEASIEAFISAARADHADLPDFEWEVRGIGFDDETTQQIFELIRARDKTGTFTLPWIVERTDALVPHKGMCLILVDMSGRPTLLVQLGEVREAIFGEVTAQDTAIDGSPVRDPTVWVPLHTEYWNGLLEPYGLNVSDDMPFWIEPFTLIFDADAQQ